MISTEKLVEIVRDLQVKQTSKTSGKGNKWIATLVGGLLVIVIISILGFRAWRQGKKLAKLLHERDQVHEDAHQAALDAIMATGDTEIEEAAQTASQLRKRLRDLEFERARIKQEHHDTVNKIQSITSWDDITKYLGR